MWKNHKVLIITVVLIIILVGVSIWASAKNGISIFSKNTTTDPSSGIDTTLHPVICNPSRPGYTIYGEFSIQCAGGTPACDSAQPGYDVNGNLQSYCGVPCDPNNLAYDVNGNFNILCGGGVQRVR